MSDEDERRLVPREMALTEVVEGEAERVFGSGGEHERCGCDESVALRAELEGELSLAGVVGMLREGHRARGEYEELRRAAPLHSLHKAYDAIASFRAALGMEPGADEAEVARQARELKAREGRLAEALAEARKKVGGLTAQVAELARFLNQDVEGKGRLVPSLGVGVVGDAEAVGAAKQLIVALVLHRDRAVELRDECARATDEREEELRSERDRLTAQLGELARFLNQDVMGGALVPSPAGFVPALDGKVFGQGDAVPAAKLLVSALALHRHNTAGLGAELKSERDYLSAQVEALARFVDEEVPGELSWSEGVCECAVRVMRSEEMRRCGAVAALVDQESDATTRVARALKVLRRPPTIEPPVRAPVTSALNAACPQLWSEAYAAVFAALSVECVQVDDHMKAGLALDAVRESVGSRAARCAEVARVVADACAGSIRG